MSGTTGMDGIDETVMLAVSKAANAKLGPVCAFLGGIAAQEVMKACSKKYVPITQWFYYDSFETLEALEKDAVNQNGGDTISLQENRDQCCAICPSPSVEIMLPYGL